MAYFSNMAKASFRLPAVRISGLRQRGAAGLHQPRSLRRPLKRPPPSQQSSCRLHKSEPFPAPSQEASSPFHSTSPARINKAEPSPAQAQGKPSPTSSISDALASASPSDNNLLAPVHVPEDPNAVLKENHPAASVLANSGLVVQRQIEMMNLFLGFEQANRYVIMDPQGNHVGYMAEHDGGFGKVMGRQWFGTHRAFTTHIFNREHKEVLRFYRPFSVINSLIRVYDPLHLASSLNNPSPAPLISTTNTTIPGATEQSAQISSLPLSDMCIIGEVQSQWHALQRNYNLFRSYQTPQISHTAKSNSNSDDAHYTQFAYISEPPFSWDFSLLSSTHQLLGSVNRNFSGFAREIFTDTGVYALRMDAAGLEDEAKKRHLISRTAKKAKAFDDVLGGSGAGRDGEKKVGMTLDQRAIMLATAVTVDYDYFSHLSGSGSAADVGFWPIFVGGPPVGAETGAAEGGAVAGVAVRGAEAGEGAMAEAGSLAGYEALQTGMGRGEQVPQQTQQQAGFNDASPQAPQQEGQGDLWGQQNESVQDGWGGSSSSSSSSSSSRGEDVWGQDGKDPWSGRSEGAGDGENSGNSGSRGGGGDGSESEDGFWDDFD